MKTTHRELIKTACRILSTVYFSKDFVDEANRLAKIRVALVNLAAETPEEIMHMLGHDIMDEIDSEE